jgi:hypothetical protein
MTQAARISERLERSVASVVSIADVGWRLGSTTDAGTQPLQMGACQHKAGHFGTVQSGA